MDPGRTGRVENVARQDRITTSRVLMWTGLGYAVAHGSVGLGAETERIAEAFNWTVVFLMAMPYAILAGVAAWIGCHYMRARRKRSAQERAAELQLVKKGEPRG